MGGDEHISSVLHKAVTGCRARVPIKTLPPGEGEQLWVEVEEAQKGFGSLKGLRSAMDAMRLSHATGQQGARVSQASHCLFSLPHDTCPTMLTAGSTTAWSSAARCIDTWLSVYSGCLV